MHEFHVSCSHTEWGLFFEWRNSPCFGRSFAYQNQNDNNNIVLLVRPVGPEASPIKTKTIIIIILFFW